MAAACTKADKTYSSDTGKQLNIFLDYDKDGYFELTNYDGLDAFVKKFKEDALKLTSGKCTNGSLAALKSIKVNTTEATALKKIEGLDPAVTLTIPATSKITSIANGTNDTRNQIDNKIINNTILSAGNYTIIKVSENNKTLNLTATSDVTLDSNEGGLVNYVDGATLTLGTGFDQDNYGTIAYAATTYNGMTNAMEKGANQVTVTNINVGFFSQKIEGVRANGDSDHPAYPADEKNVGIELIFDNCGNLGDLQAGMEATTVTMKGGTTCTKLTNITVQNWNLYDTTTLGSTDSNEARATIEKIRVMSGVATINRVNSEKVAVYDGATATLSAHANTPKYLAVEGTVTFKAAGSTGSLTTDAYGNVVLGSTSSIVEQVIVTGNLTTTKNIVAKDVYVGPNTNIVLSGNIKGVAASQTVFATRFEQIAGTANFYYLGSSQQIWSGLTTAWNGQY